MVELLNEFGPLINTSFNCHGHPIVFGQKEIERDHIEQRKLFPIITVIQED